MVTSGGLEPPAYGLGNRRSILLSYEVTFQINILEGTEINSSPVIPHFPSRSFSHPCPTRRLAIHPIAGIDGQGHQRQIKRLTTCLRADLLQYPDHLLPA